MNELIKKDLVLALAFVAGAVTGGVLVRIEAPAPAAAQASSPTPMMPGMPMPMSSCMPMMQMPPAKSAADRGYMGAMMQMHGSMMRTTMTGNADRDFMMMMIPHHEAAVAMAQTELQYGVDPKVKALAQRIISAQRSEIKEMNSWLK